MEYRRKEVIGDCVLYQADCMDILPHLDKVDAVVTSPPYDGLRDYGEGFSGLDWRSIIPLLSESIGEGGVIMWNVADATVDGSETGTSFKQALMFMDAGLNLHDTMIYIKDNVNFPESTRYFNGHEYMFVFSKGKPSTFNPILDRMNKWRGTPMRGTDRQKDGRTTEIRNKGKDISNYGMRFNWWKMDNKNRVNHPAVMPYAMASGHIESWSNAGETILDPFMGSGTTGVACAKMGRKFIGIELDPDYFDIACRRIEEAYAQPDMFVQPPAEAKQEGFDL